MPLGWANCYRAEPWSEVVFEPAPAPIAEEIERQYRVRRLAVLPELRERFYAITVERRLRHPGVVAISASARERLS